MKKILASILTIAMLISTMSACVIPASAATTSVENLYAVDFDDMTINGVNWVTSAPWHFGYQPEGHVGYMYIASNDKTNHSITVEYDPAVAEADRDENTNKVLKLSAGSSTNGVTRFRPNFILNGSTGGAHAKTRADMVGKKLVYTARIYFPSNFGSADIAMMFGNSGHQAFNGAGIDYTSASRGTNGYGMMVSRDSLYPAIVGRGSTAKHDITGWNSAGTHKVSDKLGGWHTYKVVVDTSEAPSATHSDTTRTYVDDKLVTTPGDPTTFATQGQNANYDTSISTWIDHLPTAKLFTATQTLATTEYHSFGDFTGAAFYIGGAMSGYDATYYLDDLEAYMIDPLSYTLSDNFGNYTGGTISLAFNQPIRESVIAYTGSGGGNTTYALENMFSLKDSTGATVTDGIKYESISADKKTVTLKPSATLAAGDYKLVVSPYFVDEYGQGLNSNNTAREIDLKVGEIVAFKATVAQPTITGYLEGNEATSVVTFSKAVVESSLANAITVTNTDTGAAVTEGFTYSLADDKMTLTFDFSGLPTANYTVTGSTAILSEELGENLAAAFTITIEDAIFYGTNFEEFTLDGADWTESNNQWYSSVSVPTENGNKILYVRDAGTTSTNTFVGIVNDPLGANNQVVKLDAGTTSELLWFKPSHDGSTYDQDPILTRDQMEGKKLVYSAMVYIPTDISSGEAQIFGTWKHNQQIPRGYTNLNSGTLYPYTMGAGAYSNGMARTNVTTGAISGKWAEIKYVVDYSEPLSETHSDTIRVYIDGKLTEANKEAAFVNQDPNGTYALDRNSYIDHLPFDIDGAYFRSGVTSHTAENFYGVGFKVQGNGTGRTVVYIDDVKAYLINPLDYDLSDNFTNYTGGTISLTFNQKIAESVTRLRANALTEELDLESLFTLVDSTGATIDGIDSVELSADKKTVIIKPSAGLNAGDYKLVISPFFVDIHGQGLNNNSTAREIDLKVGEIVSFKVNSISKEVISNYAEGRNATSTVVFAKEVNEASLANGIVVTNTDTSDNVTTGYTATLSADKKTLTFDFSNLPTANYTVTLTKGILSVEGEALVAERTITIEKDDSYLLLFEETFDKAEDNYVAGANWIDAANSHDFNNASYTGFSFNNIWDIQVQGANTTGAFVGVVDTTGLGLGDNFSGKALKLTAGSALTSVRRNFNATREALKANETNLEGKLLVVEADFIRTKKTASDGSRIMAYSHNTAYVRPNLLGLIGNYTSIVPLVTGYGSLQVAEGREYQTSALKTSKTYAWWTDHITGNLFTTTTDAHKVRTVLDVTEEKDHMRMYVDDNLSVVTENRIGQVLPGHARSGADIYDFAGVEYKGWSYPGGYNGKAFTITEDIFGISNEAIAGQEFYIDNFKAYLVDEFVIESVEGVEGAFNAATGTIKYTFSSPVDKATATPNANITLVDENGNKVTDGIREITFDDSDFVMNIKLNTELTGNKNYTVKIGLGLRDIYDNVISPKYTWTEYEAPAGSGVTKNSDGTATYVYEGTSVTAQADAYIKDAAKMKTEVTFVTSKSTSLYADATDASVNGTTVNTTVTFTNPTSGLLPVWGGVAVFGAYNEMIGFTPITTTEVAAGATTSETITVNATSADIEAVKLFVWDTYTNMVPYQTAETLFPVANAQ